MTDPSLFTDEEYEEFFKAGEPLGPKSRRLPKWARLLGLFVAAAMAVGGLLELLDLARTTPDVRAPIDIEEVAWDKANESEFGWLVEDIIIQPIDRLGVTAFVTNNPPDGIIYVSDQPWRVEELEELMDHEIGHLLDFALWEPLDPARKGGLGTEAWAECSAVDAGSRRTDPLDPGGDYHCYDDELEIYRAELNTVSQVCKRWTDRECRPLEPRSLDG